MLKECNHVAIIMDGNGRWAKAQGKPRTAGHLVGADNVRTIAIAASEMGIKYLTLYAFSTENWKRSQDEVSYIMKLPAIFSDGMVMQQQTNANLWGTATPNKKVTVTTGWNGKQYAVTADKNGSWKLSVSTPEAGGPYTIAFDDGTQKTLNNI